MSKVFLINELVAFYPEQNLLVNTSYVEKRQILGRPSSRCLEIILEDPGSIVSHQQLYDAAWENSVVETSPNTLYQTILLVRKALKAVSESTDDFIITVPRKGFVFNEKMQVKVEDVVSTSGSEHRLTENVTPSSGSKEKWQKRLLLRLKIKPILMFSIMMIVGVISLSIAGYKYVLFKQDDFTREYAYYQQLERCDLYLRQPVTLYKKEIDIFIAKHKEITSDCAIYPFRYISIVSKPVSFFVVACDKSKGSVRNCTSFFIRGE